MLSSSTPRAPRPRTKEDDPPFEAVRAGAANGAERGEAGAVGLEHGDSGEGNDPCGEREKEGAV